jgi:hypothetical protein
MQSQHSHPRHFPQNQHKNGPNLQNPQQPPHSRPSLKLAPHLGLYSPITFTAWSDEITDVFKLIHLGFTYLHTNQKSINSSIYKNTVEGYELCHNQLNKILTELIREHFEGLFVSICHNSINYDCRLTKQAGLHVDLHNLDQNRTDLLKNDKSGNQNNISLISTIPQSTSLDSQRLARPSDESQFSLKNQNLTPQSIPLTPHLDWSRLSSTQTHLVSILGPTTVYTQLNWAQQFSKIFYFLEFYSFHSLNMRLLNSKQDEINSDSTISVSLIPHHSPTTSTTQTTQPPKTSTISPQQQTPSPSQVRPLDSKSLNSLILTEEYQNLYKNTLNDCLNLYFDFRMAILTLTPQISRQTLSDQEDKIKHRQQGLKNNKNSDFSFFSEKNENKNSGFSSQWFSQDLTRTAIDTARSFLFTNTGSIEGTNNSQNSNNSQNGKHSNNYQDYGSTLLSNLLSSLTKFTSSFGGSNTYLCSGLDEVAKNVDFLSETVILKYAPYNPSSLMPVAIYYPQNWSQSAPNGSQNSSNLNDFDHILHPAVEQYFATLNPGSSLNVAQEQQYQFRLKSEQEFRKQQYERQNMSFQQEQFYQQFELIDGHEVGNESGQNADNFDEFSPRSDHHRHANIDILSNSSINDQYNTINNNYDDNNHKGNENFKKNQNEQKNKKFQFLLSLTI